MDLSNVTWLLTGLGAVVVLLTRVRLGGEDRGSGVSSVSRSVLAVHTVVGVLTVAAWVVALVTAREEIVYGALAGWWVLTITGLLLLARWLPSGGRHSEDAATDAWGNGVGLSALGHFGMLIGVCYFTWVGLTGRI